MPSLFGGDGGGSIPNELTLISGGPAYNLRADYSTDTGQTSTFIGETGSPAQLAYRKYLPSVLSKLSSLEGTITPGSSLVRKARLAQIENARNQAVGNLRDNLARRRVLGSSFGADALARTESEFAQQKSNAEAQSFLEEYQLNTDLLNREIGTVMTGIQKDLAELSAQTGLSLNFAQIGAQMTQASAALAQQQAQAQTDFWTGLAGFAIAPIAAPSLTSAGNSLSSSLFSSGASGGGQSPGELALLAHAAAGA